MATTHSSPLAWKIPWTEGPGRLQSMGSLGVGHDWATSLSLFTFMHWQGNGNPLQCSCLENPRVGGACWAAVYGVAQSRTRLKRLSSSSSSSDWTAARSLQSSPNEAGAVKKKAEWSVFSRNVSWKCSSPGLQTIGSEASSSWLHLSPEVNSKPGVGWRIHFHRC